MPRRVFDFLDGFPVQDEGNHRAASSDGDIVLTALTLSIRELPFPAGLSSAQLFIAESQMHAIRKETYIGSRAGLSPIICYFHYASAFRKCRNREKINYRKVFEVENKTSLPAHIVIERAVHIRRSAVRYHQVAKELIHIEVLM